MRSQTAPRLTRLTVALALIGALAWLVATVGPAATVTAATTGTTTGATDTGTGAITRTETRTVTEPARTDTVTETSTPQPTGTTSVTNRTATVQLTPASATTTTSEPSSSSGLPWWGWALIGLGAVLIGLVMFMAGRHRSGRPPGGPAGTQQPPMPGTGRTA
jgi:hypothetical protein